MWRAQRHLCCDVVEGVDLLHLRPLDDIAIQRCVWETSTVDGRCARAAIPLHWECPVTPDRPHVLDTVGDVEERMDGERACGDTVGIVLIVDPGGNVRIMAVVSRFITYFS